MDSAVRPCRPSCLRLLVGLALVLALVLGPALSAGAEDPPAPRPTDVARKNAIKGLKSKIRKLANSPWVHKKTAEILKHLEALGALRGQEAGLAALEALPCTVKEVRDAAFNLVELEHDKVLVKPLAALLEDKRYRRDADAKRRIAHALSVMDHRSAIEPLAALIRFDEDAQVVAEAADALAGYGPAPLKDRRIAVRRLVDLYETTYNYKESVRPEDKLPRQRALARYKVYGKPVRYALQALTGQTHLTRPMDWRRWWNENKKKSKWPSQPGSSGSRGR